MAVCLIGFKKYYWFISIGYGLSISAISIGVLVIFGGTLPIWSIIYGINRHIIRNIVISCICVLCFASVTVAAKSLSDCFSGGVYSEMSYANSDMQYYSYSSVCYAKTEGYSGLHYVRAYFGDPDGSHDSGRVWSSGNNYASARYSIGSSCLWGNLFRPSAYAKYGTR